ncbi:MAG: hypothetical protein B6245_18895 [Desulfobacteraceae bacterium 4572_88]|nr:MAG: hypothetical protein B6245_18895 [Desulfobacteraceae bacterium 4572_88]
MKMIRDESGFTMIELFIVIALMSIMAAFAVPNYMSWIPNYKLKTAIQEVFSNFQKAKLTAIKMNVNCTVTFGQAIGDDTYDYVVYVDSDNDLEYDDGEEIIAKVDWEEKYDKVVESGSIDFGVENDNDLESIAFRPNGLTRNNTGGFGAGTVSLKNTNNRQTEVIVGSAGNIRINKVN